MSDPVTIQLISAVVTLLLALLAHRIHGSRENHKIQTNLNGDRKAMLDKLDAMQAKITELTGANIKLEAEKIGEAEILPSRLATIIKKLVADATAGSARVPNILIVDDSPTDTELMRIAVELVGGNAICVPNGERAMEIFTANLATIDLVFLDMNLPGMDGVMVIRKIRALSRRVPVVFVTGSISPQGIEEATKHGSVSMLVKPLDRDNLREILLQHGIPFPDPQNTAENLDKTKV